MKYRRLGKTNFEISEVSLGTWQLGEAWGTVSDEDAVRVLETALDRGVNFFDTADVYGDGRSERYIAQVLAKDSGKVYVATKAGRRLQPHTPDGYNRKNLTAFVRSHRRQSRTAGCAQAQCPRWRARFLVVSSDKWDSVQTATFDEDFPPWFQIGQGNRIGRNRWPSSQTVLR